MPIYACKEVFSWSKDVIWRVYGRNFVGLMLWIGSCNFAGLKTVILRVSSCHFIGLKVCHFQRRMMSILRGHLGIKI